MKRRKRVVVTVAFILAVMTMMAGCVQEEFKIEGKWKSVGSTGIGQAQPGAIVVFDGSTCNFYSPRDTYVLNEDGEGKYKLEVTGLLGGSMSLPVTVEDNDHITINGSTKLERVE